MMHKRLTKWILRAVLVVLLCCAWPEALAASPAAAPLTSGNTQNGMVRVRLSSLGNPSSLTLTVYGSYTVNGQSTRTLSSGSSVTVKKSGADLTLTAGGSTFSMGTSFKLRRHETGGQNGVKIAQARIPGNLYPGDFTFTLQGATLYVVASIYVEDYLYGVLPYEMGDLSGIEALKAQAVAARTYTLRAMSSNSGRLYDVVDTTADQVYNGTPSGNANCKKAVDATKGIVVKNGSSFTATYYTASNGGQTESLKNAWGVANNAALVVKEDPFDLRNPASMKKSFTVSASGRQSNQTLNSLLQKKAAAVFGAGAEVTGVCSVYAHTPRYDGPSQLFTKLTFAVTYARSGRQDSGNLTFDIFGELEGPLGMSINATKNELWSVTDSATGFTVTARRFGHGIGMSQRGAMQMAKEGYTYAQILGFYYAGCTRVQYTLNRSILSPVVNGKASSEQIIAEQPAAIESSAPTAAPAPTESPAPAASPAPSALTAIVTTPKGSLNLRKSPKDTARVLRTVPQNETVTVLEKGSAWCKVAYAGVTGHVMTRFPAFGDAAAPAGSSAASAPSPSPAPAASAGPYARVTTAQGSLKMRKAAQENGKILRTIPQYASVEVVKKNVTWTKVTYEGTTGFVMTKFLTFADAPAPSPTSNAAAAPEKAATPAPAQQSTKASANTLTARVATKSGSLYLRKTRNDSSKILSSIPQNTVITLLSKGSKWCKATYDGKTGYVMTKFLAFDGGSQPAAAKSSAPAKTARETLKELKVAVLGQVISPNGNKLNLRAACESNARVLRQMPPGESLTITAVGDTWCAVTWQDQSGYCMKEFLEFTLYE